MILIFTVVIMTEVYLNNDQEMNYFMMMATIQTPTKIEIAISRLALFMFFIATVVTIAAIIHMALALRNLKVV
jgi:hypothetical protein